MVRTILKQKDIRKHVLFVFLVVVILRFGAQLPIPLLDVTAMKTWLSSDMNSGFSLLNAFTGGALENMSVFALSVTPYITASIILELLCVAFPKLSTFRKEDAETGGYKMLIVTRVMTIVVALLSAVGLMVMLSRNGMLSLTFYTGFLSVVTMVAGTMFLVWLGEELSEYGLGNGISMILMLNILSRMPSDVYSIVTKFIVGEAWWVIVLVVITVLLLFTGTIMMVVMLEGSARVIPVNYANHSGRGLRGKNISDFSLKVNIAGVIPVIFASTLLSLPLLVGNFFRTPPAWFAVFSQSKWFNPETLWYTVGYLLYAVLVVFFAYFYVSISFDTKEIAKNMQRRGGAIPGVRPGKPTTEFLNGILKPLIWIGALWLLVIATVPMLVNGISGASISFGGTSVIIIAGVVLEAMTELDGMLTMRHYRGFI